MTSQTNRASWPKGQHSSERAFTVQHPRQENAQNQNNRMSAERAPGSGLLLRPEPGARWQYGNSGSYKHRETPTNTKSILTEATWTRTGLRPVVKGQYSHTSGNVTQPSNTQDPPPQIAHPIRTGTQKESFSRQQALNKNLRHHSAKTFSRIYIGKLLKYKRETCPMASIAGRITVESAQRDNPRRG